ncbi:4'-phosphopantetheinyl transferase family protein [Pedobacter chitinilyticus]|uniref:4'-phosphopantetheinyl transferase superfamily protein n=1 Tax=Pedobacter chitinilyticus TaxID=2233776 RepID=A0A3S3PN25_9SPHI|nr:4'-phosphopantetheinyl transferase superfamily protein [Pedobacter chitinilyticus]RWU06258.1 4'-phosphopantetheinyl transferase superfamily protein [Pedobacter chitinilyticus]
MPVVFDLKIDAHTELAVWKIEESHDQLMAGLQLKQHELEIIDSFKSDKRALQWLSTRLLLRTMLDTKEYIDCQMDDQGKPYLVNYDYHISLSHSYDYAAVMISRDPQKKVGLDMEIIKHKIKLIRHKFLSDVELAQKQIGDNIHGLYVCWCAKEAIYKWHGRKELEFKRDIHIKPFKLRDEGELTAVVDLPKGVKELNVNYFKTDDGYMLGYVIG